MITKEMLRKLAPTAKEEIISHLAENLDDQLAKYNIDDYLRVCHFLAQAAHESASFKTLEEYASGSAYEGRKDLGNAQLGDGRRYKGRGIFQLTGRANYRTYGQKLGYDLEGNPELAKEPLISIKTACEYWNSRKLSELAKAIIPKDIKLSTNKSKDSPPPPVDPIVPPIVVAKLGDNSSYVKDLQQMLISKGATIKADGAFGPMTEQAVIEFQRKSGLNATGMIDTDTLNRLMI